MTLPPRYCRGCRYELTGLAAPDSPGAVCPECGRWFNPADPRTTTATNRHPFLVFLFGPWPRAFAIAVLVVVALWFTALPRPALRWDGSVEWSLWIWLRRPIGIESAFVGPQRARIIWHMGEHPVRIEAEATRLVLARPRGVLTRGGRLMGSRVAPPGPDALPPMPPPPPLQPGDPGYIPPQPDSVVIELPSWTLARLGPDHFRLDVGGAGLGWSEVLFAFNSLRADDELFGVSIESAASDVNTEAFSAEGTRAELLAAVVDRYGLGLASMPLAPDSAEVWIFDPPTRSMRKVAVSEAEARGIAVRPYGPRQPNRHRFTP
ncbi:MAG: hypothetical protein IBJ11_07390 [Phycisphaerales bacterium]|nr:hypothetical protein [Phycisphaerales bacterium]